MKALLGSVAVLVFIAAMTGTPAQAQHREECREHMDRAEAHLSHMLHRFGPRSDAVREARFDFLRVRDMCFRWDYGRHNRDGRHDWRGPDKHDHIWHGDRRKPRRQPNS